MVLEAIYFFILSLGAIQFMHGGVLIIFGYPSIYSNYLEGFYTKEPKRLSDSVFNIIFWVTISIAYYTFKKASLKYGFWKVKLYYGIGWVVALFLYMFVFNPIFTYYFPVD
ncbi:hypothetical protein [Shouchella clausii]|jgi:hypothetical protein|uniref:Uncharacterized protein n=1 Tax=Shouchella clausii TaxID=79880 RepID=A0A268S096_SHOCL|nr:hypothetical protein [Shouchella clausii]PAD44010.1 hypothetical protein CHH54_04040 [Bacillus sp. 7520-S]MEB5478104.1 hypothetical protein [Shouchella clausii]PAD14843.1 hypothetical protein CHH74_07705 [Shouchella clausii]PAE98500.1 hypothetical protein CHH71_04055 [Shouchella clausii]PAF25935.1 hypothetical protein CHH61_11035 [Shouchella clausii]